VAVVSILTVHLRMETDQSQSLQPGTSLLTNADYIGLQIFFAP